MTRLDMLPVLIVGGGPVGLFEALLLTKLGVSVRIIEREHSISPLSKALGLQARSMEIFRFAGIISPFLQKGRPINTLNFYSSGEYSVTKPIISTPEDTEYCYGLFLEQKIISEILKDELEKLGVRIDYGWELMDTMVIGESHHQDTYVETRIRRAISGNNTSPDESLVIGLVEQHSEQANKIYETQIVKSKFMIACDGGRSTVRHKLNIAFPGRTLNTKTLMWDGIADTDIAIDGVTVVSNPNKSIVRLSPLSNGSIRVSLGPGDIEPDEDFVQTIKNLTDQQFEYLVQDHVHPLKFHIKETNWLTGFRVNERRAERFVYKGHIFIAGDAAHIHSPAGGQGMNTGLQDAHNLAWKLAFALNGIVDPELLNVRYDENYINRAYTPQAQQSEVENHQVGARALDGFVYDLFPILPFDNNINTVPITRLHELLIGIHHFHVIIFASYALDAMEMQQELSTLLNQYLHTWRSRWCYSSSTIPFFANQDLFKIHILAKPNYSGRYGTKLQDLFSQKNEGDGRVYIDTEAKLHTKYGFNNSDSNARFGGMVIVRPDSHIAFRVEDDLARSWKAVDQYFGDILIPTEVHH
ncbi:hypothetical protein FBU30_006143 [Linnemannia zychae]|nr:hypothetical protein FBU30_006143 [Linnemannia zychae]